MEFSILSSMASAIQAIDPGYAILSAIRPLLDIFGSETCAPDVSLAMIMSALLVALYFKYWRIEPACEVLRIRANFLKKCTTNRIFSDNFYEFDLLMREGIFLEAGWNEFVETCLLHHSELKSDIEITVRPQDFINMRDAEHTGLGIRWFHALSGYYIGVGLLFTFAGLVAALYFSSEAINVVLSTAAAPNLGSHDTDVQRALAMLLSAAIFKFLTSIAGLGCSIVLVYLEGRWCSRIQRGFDDLCRELERCTVMVTPESIAERQCRMLSDIAEQLKTMAAMKVITSEAAMPAPEPFGASPLATLDSALARIETVVVNTSQTLAASFEQSLTQLASRLASNQSPPPPPVLREEVLAATLDRSLDTALANNSRALAGTLEHMLTNVLMPAITHALGPIRQALVFAEAPVPSVAPSSADVGLLEAAARIEAALATAVSDLRDMAGETRGVRADMAASLAELAATLRSEGERNTAVMRNGFSDLAAREQNSVATASPVGPVLDSLQEIAARLSVGIDRLTGGFDQVESALATHVAAFEAVSRSTREAEQAIAGSARTLQTACLPLSRVGTDLSGSVSAIAAGVEGSVHALLEGQAAGQRLSEELRAISGQLQEVWNRHEARFIAVDESVARILTSIIQHTEAYGNAVREHVVTIDNHLAHAVTSLATNIEALQEMTSDLTEAVNGTDRLAALISEKVDEKQG